MKLLHIIKEIQLYWNIYDNTKSGGYVISINKLIQFLKHKIGNLDIFEEKGEDWFKYNMKLLHEISSIEMRLTDSPNCEGDECCLSKQTIEENDEGIKNYFMEFTYDFIDKLRT